ncbi:MAG TPA: FAD-dependent thymidylate synthase [Candidatus Limnocylindria bacterium]|nr:FAD-dependent thymidylate synthase [Candidatus Limnocylindria bacterium]
MTLERFYREWHEGSTHPIAKKKPTYVEDVDQGRWYTVPELAQIVHRRQESLRNCIRDGFIEAMKRPTHDPREPQLWIKGSAWHDFATRTYMAKVDLQDGLSMRYLRHCDEKTGEIDSTRVVDVWETGIRPVFKVTLANGYAVKMTKDHRCLTSDGWKTLEQATGVHIGIGGGATWREDSPKFAVNGVPAHWDREWLAARRGEGLDVQAMAERAGVSYHTIRKALRIFDLRFTAKEKAKFSGLAQRGQRRTAGRHEFSPEGMARIRAARSGQASNFWKGGITDDRQLIGAWTTTHAGKVHERNRYKCMICGRNDRLNAHHVDPVWHNPTRSRDLENLITLCGRCHRDVHRMNLELDLLAESQNGDLATFWQRHATSQPRHPEKRKAPVRKLVRAWSAIERIEYAGEEMTYDIEVIGPDHNFVANGFIVHNSVNEYSARYSILDREFYVPEPEQLAVQATSNRQGRGDVITGARAQQILDVLRQDADRMYRDYEQLLNETASGEVLVPEEQGLARELARMNLSVNFYTQWYWKTNLHNLLNFLSLRADAHAQYEIRVYAEALLSVLKDWVPHTYSAFTDYRMGAYELSAKGLAAVKRMLRGEQVERESTGMSPGEWRELMETLER